MLADLLVIGLGIHVYLSPERVGMREAERDLQSGRLKLKYITGEGDYSCRFYKSLLKERHDIELVIVAACVVEPGVKENKTGYNKVMEKEIAHRFGPHILEKTREDAERQWEAELAAHRAERDSGADRN